MRWLSVLVVPCLLLGLGPNGVAAQEGVQIEVTVSRISNEPGEIDPRGRRIDEKLRNQIRYQSLRVLEQKRLSLGIDELGSVKLPNGRSLRVRPMDVGERGVLLAVSVEGSVDSDLRVPNRHLVVFGTEPFEDGKLVIALEPSW